MTDQDKAPTYDAGLPQKPVNLDSKVPIQMGRKVEESSERLSNGGYYLNVAQKGKLILPTALWIMLIIAGICFLTLLASLSKTISTLDTLVELEQEKEARALVSEHLHHRRLSKDLESELKAAEDQKQYKQKRAKKDYEKNGRRKPAGEDNDELIMAQTHSWIMPIESSWFSMPGWTSLEPIRHEPPPPPPPRHHPPQRHQGPVPEMSMIDDIIRQLPPPDAAVVFQEFDSQPQQPPMGTGMFGSLMKQVAPMLDFLVRGDDLDKAKDSTMLLDEPEEAPAIISAKIDNLNVHINSAPPTQAAATADDHKKAAPANREEQQITDLEKSIDDLVGKLMAPPHMSHHGKQHKHMEPQIEEIIPIVNHEALHRRPAPFSPLANLLLPPGLPQLEHDSGPMFIQTFADGPHGMKGHHQSGPTNDNLGDAQLIISISDGPELNNNNNNNNNNNKPSRETYRHHVSNTRRPAPSQSPYEFPSFVFGDDMMLSPFGMMSMEPSRRPSQHNHHDGPHDHHVTKPGKEAGTPWDLLANDMVNALVEEMVNQQQQPKHADKNFNTYGDVLFFGKPMGPPKAESSIPPMEPINPNGPHQDDSLDSERLGDVFTFLLGPPPASKLVVGEPEQPAKKDKGYMPSTKSHVETGERTNETTTNSIAADPASTIQQAPSLTQTTLGPVKLSVSTNEPKMTPEAQAAVDSIIGQMPGKADGDKLARGEPADVLVDLMGPLFSLPQMAGDQQQASVAGAKPASGGTPVETTTAATPAAITSSPWILTEVLRANTTGHAPRKTGNTINSIFSKVVGFFKDTSKKVEPNKTTIAASSSPMSTTPVPSAAVTQLVTGISDAPIVEAIEMHDAPHEVPVLDLTPFAKSRAPLDKDDASKNSSGPTTPKVTDGLDLTRVEPPTETSTTMVPQSLPNSSTLAPKGADSVMTTPMPKTAPNPESKLPGEAQAGKSFFQGAGDFIERNILNLRNFIHPSSSNNSHHKSA